MRAASVHLLAGCQLGCSCPLRHISGIIALLVRLLWLALPKDIGALPGHGEVVARVGRWSRWRECRLVDGVTSPFGARVVKIMF